MCFDSNVLTRTIQSFILSSCSLAPTSTLMQCPSSSHSRTRILWVTTLTSSLRYRLPISVCITDQRFCIETLFQMLSWSFMVVLSLRLEMTCGRTCWRCRSFGSWIRSGSRRDLTWGWSSSAASLQDGAEVNTHPPMSSQDFYLWPNFLLWKQKRTIHFVNDSMPNTKSINCW